MKKEVNGNSIVRRIDSILVQKKDNRANLCRVLGLNQQTLSNWINRGSIPKVEDALNIANYLNVSVEWLVYGEEAAGLSNDEIALLADWKILSDQEKQSIRILIDGFKKTKSSAEVSSV